MTEFSVGESAREAGGLEVLVLELRGELDAHTFPTLQDHLNDVLDRGRSPRAVLDCTRLEYISSAGLGVLKKMTNEFRHAEGDLRLAALSKKILSVMSLLGFTQFIRTFDTVDEAVSSFAT